MNIGRRNRPICACVYETDERRAEEAVADVY